MARSLLRLLLVLAPFAGVGAVDGRPPDQVAHSPIPPLQAPSPRHFAPGATAGSFGTASGFQLGDFPVLPSPRESLDPAVLKQLKQVDSSAATYPLEQAERIELWESNEMGAARNFLQDFCRRSAQTSPEEGERFLEQLSQLPPAEMGDWLVRYQRRRRAAAEKLDIDQQARELMIGRALDRQAAEQQSYENASRLRADAIEAMRAQHLVQRRSFAPRDDSYGFDWGPCYDPLEAVVDPASPRGYDRRVAAAMSLPGDLPASDPRNYIRGEQGVDLGEWTTGRDATPPGQ